MEESGKKRCQSKKDQLHRDRHQTERYIEKQKIHKLVLSWSQGHRTTEECTQSENEATQNFEGLGHEINQSRQKNESKKETNSNRTC